MFNTEVRARSAIARHAAYAIASFAFAAYAFITTFIDDGVPDVSGLLLASGRVIFVTHDRYSVTFRLSGRDELFAYSADSRQENVVKSSLEAAGDKQVAILFEADPINPWIGAGPYYNVWHVVVAGKTVRSFAETKARRLSNNLSGTWISGALFLCAIYFVRQAWKARRFHGFA